jgi:hypothetical protein
MAVKKLMETTIPETYQNEMDAIGLILHATYCDKIADALFTGVSSCLNIIKRKDKPAAFIFDEINGNFVGGAVVSYHEGKNGDPGNWSYIWTFNKEDIPENAKIVKITDSQTHNFFTSYTLQKYKFTLMEQFIVDMYTVMIKCISKWLDDNANKDDVEGVELEGVFLAQVAVEGEEVVKTIEPLGETKVLIKDDASIETA